MNFLPLPENISSFGGEIDSLTYLITYLTMGALLIAEGILLYFILRFRKKPGQKASYIPGRNWSQLRWIIIPLIVIVGLDLFIDEKNTHAWTMIKQEIPEKSHYELVQITGQQFSWMFTYPGKDGLLGTVDDFTVPNELHIPVNETVVFYLRARDVLHSFSIPTMRIKQDAVPGRTIKGWFDSTKVGQFEIACAEICGVGHSLMRATVFVHPEAEYRSWVKQQVDKVDVPAPGPKPTPYQSPVPDGPSPEGEAAPAEGAAAKTDAAAPAEGVAAKTDAPAAAVVSGKDLLQAKTCLSCHSLDGSKLVGPSYKGLFGSKVTVVSGGQEKELTIDEAYLRRSILEPNADVVKGFPAAMPKLSLSDAELNSIITFLKEQK